MVNNWKKLVGIGASAALIFTATVGFTETANATEAANPTVHLSNAEIAKAMNTPTTLTFWTWVQGIQKEVALFHAKYPKIKVNVVNVGQGGAQYQKIRSAAASNNGLPDLAQIELQYLPTFNQISLLKNISPYLSPKFKSMFPDWIVSQISGLHNEILAVPQDSGPMGMLYRADIFTKYNIAVPTTWAEFAVAAKKLHDANPNVFMTDFAANEAGNFNGLAWQAGSRPFVYRAKNTYQIRLNDDNSLKVASYWANLVKAGTVATDPAWNNDWYAGFNSGKYATWLTAAWGPLFLSGAAKDTSGDWRVAPLPQWSAGSNVSGNWGGSTTAVMKTSAHPIAAAVFAEFLNTTHKSALQLALAPQFLFPATKSIASDPAFTNAKPDFFGGQQVNKIFGEIANSVGKNYQWSPFQDQVYTEWAVVGKAIAEKADVATALKTFQANVVAYAMDQGFTVQK
jgi:multiple sugar transport system substrate-binding protein